MDEVGVHGFSALLPLDRAGRLGGDVVDDAVDALHLVDDPARDRRRAGRTGSRAQSAVIASWLSRRGARSTSAYVRKSPITPTVRTGSSTAKACQSSRSSPAARISSCTMASASRSTSSRSSVTSPSTRMARPGPGKRLAPDDLGGQPEQLADLAHLVLEQLAQRLDQLEPHVRGQPADVVVRLDRRRRALERHRLDHVRIERALGEPRDRRRASAPRPRRPR